jgi:hypothetical protein
MPLTSFSEPPRLNRITGVSISASVRTESKTVTTRCARSKPHRADTTPDELVDRR